MTRYEIQAVLVISLIIALRLLGIFLVLPVFSVYALNYAGATLPMVGLAFGVYALVQSLLQLPFGWASDRFGRKPLLLFGLLMFTAGSFACGYAATVVQLTVGRALQGTGAISSVGMASMGDLTRPQVRTQAFTITGITVGSTFILGLLCGPMLASRIGLSGLFYVLGFIGSLGVLVTWLLFPSISPKAVPEGTQSLKGFARNVEVRKLCLAAFVLSFVLNLFLFRYPLDWADLGFPHSGLWKVYSVIFLPSLLLVFPYIRYAERKGDLRTPPALGWLFMAGGHLLYIVVGPGEKVLYATGAAFFLGYTLFQPMLPSILTQLVLPNQRGAAIGVYNLTGFLGASVGGILAGSLSSLNHYVPFIVGFTVLLGWILLGFPRAPGSNAGRLPTSSD